MKENEKRKEVWLEDSVIEKLQILADRKNWSLKQYMEFVLIRQSVKAVTSKKTNNA